MTAWAVGVLSTECLVAALALMSTPYGTRS